MMSRALFIFLCVAVALAGSCAGWMGWHHGPHMGDGGYGMFVMWIVVLLVLGLIVYFLVYVLQKQGPKPGAPEAPLDILKKRYARGEITRAEFEERKRDLES